MIEHEPVQIPSDPMSPVQQLWVPSETLTCPLGHSVGTVGPPMTSTPTKIGWKVDGTGSH